MSTTKRGRLFPRPFRIDGSYCERGSSSSNTAGASIYFDGDSEDEIISSDPRTSSSSNAPSSSSRPPLFSSELPPPSIHERFNKDGTENVEWARYQSTLRLKSKWDSIYERYKDAHLIEQDEIEVVLSDKAKEGLTRKKRKKKSGGKVGVKKRRKLPFGRVGDDDSAAESDSEFGTSDTSSSSDELPPSSSSSSGGLRIVRDCGILRNLASTLHFGSFMKEEELSALEAVDFLDADGEEVVGGAGTATLPSSEGSSKKATTTRKDDQDDEDAFSEVEVGSDEDEIGGWGETGFVRSQYPEFDDDQGRTGLSRTEAEDVEQGKGSSSSSSGHRIHDPDLEEFLLAEEQRRRLCASSSSGSEGGDLGDEEEGDEAVVISSVVPHSGVMPLSDLMEEQQEYMSSDDDLDLLHVPRRKGPTAATPTLKPAQEEARLRPIAEIQRPPALKKAAVMLPAPSSSGPTTTKPLNFLPSFEEAQRSKRTAVDGILARWTHEQETYLAQLEEDAFFRFDLGISRPNFGVQEEGPGGNGVWDSLPVSYRGIPGLEQMLLEHS
ncbi:hypothetical protein A4X09_0g4764 [Tilletia walkeri]|uniref:Uncharacterized protein n=1 Tax=Tilletia walkeri TaxID=117179 RepID=A0A8X7N8J1_9BASI|nr:hypothetical protein A4X09_0g4764 [Tilletia walkeri]